MCPGLRQSWAFVVNRGPRVVKSCVEPVVISGQSIPWCFVRLRVIGDTKRILAWVPAHSQVGTGKACRYPLNPPVPPTVAIGFSGLLRPEVEGRSGTHVAGNATHDTDEFR